MRTIVVTGAFGYSGRYITSRLLDRGHRVRTLTNSPNRPNPFGDRVEVFPLTFEDPERLTEALTGADALINTYWVRFNSKTFNHEDAVKNTLALFAAAKSAGVRRVVHVSITKPSKTSDLTYFRGKARLEEALIASGLSRAILRPAVLFGGEDILVNNIAWSLRRFPLFILFGRGDYKLQPIYVNDLAHLAVEQAESTENVVINAIGPETFTFRGLVEQIGRIIGKPRPMIPLPPGPGYLMARMIGLAVGDTFLTRDEITGLMRNHLYVDAPPAGTTRLTLWAEEHAETLGIRYASEMARRRDRTRSYDAM